MKRLSVILMACLLVLGMSQCKKEKPNETNEESVSISLKVIGDNVGSKVIVTPGESTAPVTYENGDVIYVVSEGKYVGKLTRIEGTFTGGVTGAVTGQPLSFFFLGNKEPEETLEAGTTTSCTIDISDQTSELPVISYGTSLETFEGVTSSYTCKLNNQCGLVKFSLDTDISAATPVTVTGMNSSVTVNFGTHVFTPATGTGTITLKAESNQERWAILPINSSAVTTATASAEGYYASAAFTVPAITANAYLGDDEKDVEVPSMIALIGPFTVDASGTKVYFAPGNLQATTSNLGNTWTWAFAEHQWDNIGDAGINLDGSISSDGSGSTTGNGTIDLFRWSTASTCFGICGTNGGGDEPGGGIGKHSLSDPDYSGAFVDWGSNTIYNPKTGRQDPANTWRTLTNAEWNYLIEHHTWGCATIHHDSKDWNGIIILPDNHSWNNFNTNHNSYFDIAMSTTGTTWITFEANHALFLPAAGFRGNSFGKDDREYNNSEGYYWSSTYANNNYHFLKFYSSGGGGGIGKSEISNNGISCAMTNNWVYTRGYSVRLVCE